MLAALLVFFAQTVTASTPLMLATLGGVVSERSGVATIALEGYLLAGAFGAAVAALATGSLAAAIACAALAGALMAGVFALGAVGLRANAIVVGVAVNLLAAAGTRVALKVLYDSASNSPPILAQAARSGSLSRVAVTEALAQPTVWLVPVAWLIVQGVLFRTVFGLRIQAVGEHPEAARSQGVAVGRVRVGAVILGGAIAGVGGAHLALHQHEFVAYMSGGRGFLAIAAVILGGWRPGRAALAALGIGALAALEATLAGRVHFRPAILQALPFAATLVAVVGVVGRTRAPRALG